MNIFGIHFCPDEARALMMAIPVLPALVIYIRSKLWKTKQTEHINTPTTEHCSCITNGTDLDKSENLMIKDFSQ